MPGACILTLHLGEAEQIQLEWASLAGPLLWACLEMAAFCLATVTWPQTPRPWGSSQRPNPALVSFVGYRIWKAAASGVNPK